MGLTLHYSATLRDINQLPDLVAEVEDICRSMNWPSQRVDLVEEVPAEAMPLEPGEGDVKHIRLQGILFTPPGCETVCLACTPSGRLSGPIQLRVAGRYPSPDLVYCLHVKTQYAGEDTHVALVLLLKYLEKKYFRDMEVYDEGNYWDTLDKTVLSERFAEYRRLIDVVKTALEKESFQETDNSGTIANQIERIIRDRLGDGEGAREDAGN